jgi:hypothetical protein
MTNTKEAPAAPRRKRAGHLGQTGQIDKGQIENVRRVDLEIDRFGRDALVLPGRSVSLRLDLEPDLLPHLEPPSLAVQELAVLCTQQRKTKCWLYSDRSNKVSGRNTSGVEEKECQKVKGKRHCSPRHAPHPQSSMFCDVRQTGRPHAHTHAHAHTRTHAHTGEREERGDNLLTNVTPTFFRSFELQYQWPTGDNPGSSWEKVFANKVLEHRTLSENCDGRSRGERVL